MIGTPSRISGLDFTKGTLVLIMVLYHWLDYFLGPHGEYFRYLRFLTPSFICISGFLISNVYFSKYTFVDPRLPRRLGKRGLKILGIFIVLNLAIGVFVRGSYNGTILFAHVSLVDMIALFIKGNNLVEGVGKIAAFYVLIPIAELLLLSAGIVFLCRRYKHAFQATFLCCLLSVMALELNGVQIANLGLITIGLFGVVLGCIPIEKINRFGRHRYLLIAAYLLYLWAITVWGVIYPLQVVGVGLSLILIYLLFGADRSIGTIKKNVVLLGKYSLLGYIVQIFILQLLHRALRLIELGSATLAVTFVAAVALTVLSVRIVDRARDRSGALDGLYKAVFA